MSKLEEHDVEFTTHGNGRATDRVPVLPREDLRHPGKGHHGDDVLAVPRM